MKACLRFLVFSIIPLALTTCKSSDPKPTVSNLTGDIAYQFSSFKIKGGLLDETLYNNDSSRHSVRFKISSQSIQDLHDSLEFYFLSTELINLDFILTTADGGPLAPGVYQFQDTSDKNTVLQSGLVLQKAIVYFGTGGGTASSGTKHTVKSGTVTLSGTFSRYVLDIDFVLDDGEVTGRASGVFITRMNWSDFFK